MNSVLYNFRKNTYTFSYLLNISLEVLQQPYITVNNEYFIQCSLQLADNVGAKKLSANWSCPPFGKFFNIGLNFENKAFFYIHKVQLG